MTPPHIQGGAGFKSPTNLSRELWREWGDAEMSNSGHTKSAEPGPSQTEVQSKVLSSAVVPGARDDSEKLEDSFVLDGKEAGEGSAQFSCGIASLAWSISPPLPRLICLNWSIQHNVEAWEGIRA